MLIPSGMARTKPARSTAHRSAARICQSTDPLHSWRGRSTLMWSIDEALGEFLAAPAAGRPQGAEGYTVDAISDGRRGFTNESIVHVVMGAAGVTVRDPATFDAVSGRHDAKCRTFEEAFRACAVPYDAFGHRDWRDFDLETLQGCCPEFEALRLPAWIEEMRMEEQLEEFYRAGGE